MTAPYSNEQTMLALVNRALSRIGETPIQAMDAGTPVGQAVQLAVETTLDALIAFYPWSFATRTVPLTRLSAAPVNGWRHGFQKPNDMLGNPHCLLADPRRRDDPLKEWDIDADALYANREPIWALIPLAVDPRLYPPHFRQAAIYALAAELVVPSSGNAEATRAIMRAEAFGQPSEAMRGGWMGLAIQADSRNQPSRTLSLGRSPLVDVRYEE